MKKKLIKIGNKKVMHRKLRIGEMRKRMDRQENGMLIERGSIQIQHGMCLPAFWAYRPLPLAKKSKLKPKKAREVKGINEASVRLYRENGRTYVSPQEKLDALFFRHAQRDSEGTAFIEVLITPLKQARGK